jgi:hypothetical protein
MVRQLAGLYKLMAVQDFEASQTRSHAARQAVAAFRGAGKGGTVEQLLADRRAETQRETVAARKPGTPSRRAR